MKTVRCQRCSRPVRETIDVVGSNGVHKWCYQCVDDFAIECRECGNIYRHGATKVYFMDPNDVVSDSDSGAVCQACYEQYYFHCRICNRLQDVDDLAFDVFHKKRLRIHHVCKDCAAEKDITPENAKEMLGIDGCI